MTMAPARPVKVGANGLSAKPSSPDGDIMLQIILRNHGIKSGPVPPADLYLDCRALYNPFHDPACQGSGDNSAVQQLVWTHSEASIRCMANIIDEAVTRLPIRRGANWFDKPFVILCLCAHGIHRSRATKHLLARLLRDTGNCNANILVE